MDLAGIWECTDDERGDNLHGATASNLHVAVTGGDRQTLDAIYRQPLSRNLTWLEVIDLFSTIGDADERNSGELVFRAGDDTLAMRACC